jgi:hypothetical protein
MSKPKVTPWFPASVKPKRVGVYQVEDEEDENFPDQTFGYKHWDGSIFGLFCGSPGDAERHGGLNSAFRVKRWRGLTKKTA